MYAFHEVRFASSWSTRFDALTWHFTQFDLMPNVEPPVSAR